MQPTKKSRKFSILAAILILLAGVLIGGYLVLNSGRGSAGQLTASQLEGLLTGNGLNIGNCQPDANDPNKDSDNDGLKDWQEIQIYHTDPCKADTDGDGYLDGEEIASGYDPLKKAPGDELPGTTHNSQRPAPIDYNTVNLTELLSQKLSEKVANGTDTNFDPQSILNDPIVLDSNPAFANTLLEIIPAFANQFFMPTISDSEIKIANDNSKTSIQNYFDQLQNAFSEASIESDVGDKNLVAALTEVTNNQDFSSFPPLAKYHQLVYEKAKQAVCPPELIPFHKDQLSLFFTVSNYFSALSNTQQDPLRALFFEQLFPQIAQKVVDFYNKYLIK